MIIRGTARNVRIKREVVNRNWSPTADEWHDETYPKMLKAR